MKTWYQYIQDGKQARRAGHDVMMQLRLCINQANPQISKYLSKVASSPVAQLLKSNHQSLLLCGNKLLNPQTSDHSWILCPILGPQYSKDIDKPERVQGRPWKLFQLEHFSCAKRLGTLGLVTQEQDGFRGPNCSFQYLRRVIKKLDPCSSKKTTDTSTSMRGSDLLYGEAYSL